VAAIRVVRNHRTLLSMTLLAGSASFLVGNAYHAQMPEFARDLGHADPDFTYSMLFAADALGALVAGIVLESRALLPPRARTAFVLAVLWCLAIGSFALATSYPVALALLFVAGFMELAFFAMAQTLLQLHAPPEMRGRVIGVFIMSAMGMRAFSGITIGLGGALIGIHGSLALSAGVLLAALLSLALVFARRSR
jgi:MFS family permease